ncbi:hypothetical protein J27TS7_46740 [Paenibacillus dendritiformis]|nr:hypothetical protein J27TS7_46740 [Paenibacillus dendritiformis]
MHADVQDQLRHGERVCPFRYLRVHSIFDDEMRVYGEDEAITFAIQMKTNGVMRRGKKQ